MIVNRPVSCRDRFMMMALIFLVGICAQYSPVDAAEVSGKLSASLDQEAAPVGGVVVLTLAYRLPEGARLLPGPEIKGLEDLTIVDLDEQRDRIEVKLQVDRLGTWKTGPLSLAYLDKAGERQVLKTDPVSLTVLSNLGEKPQEAELRPIQGIISIASLWLKYLPWCAGILGILLAAGAIFWWYKRRRSQQTSVAFTNPPHVRAKDELAELDARGLFEKGYVKEFYFGFSEILRRYMEAIRNFPAAEFTTEEIARQVDNEQDRRLLALLRQADLIKFADIIPTPAAKEEDVKKAISYIHETSPVPEDDRTAGVADGESGPTGGNQGRSSVTPMKETDRAGRAEVIQ